MDTDIDQEKDEQDRDETNLDRAETEEVVEGTKYQNDRREPQNRDDVRAAVGSVTTSQVSKGSKVAPHVAQELNGAARRANQDQ